MEQKEFYDKLQWAIGKTYNVCPQDASGSILRSSNEAQGVGLLVEQLLKSGASKSVKRELKYIAEKIKDANLRLERLQRDLQMYD